MTNLNSNIVGQMVEMHAHTKKQLKQKYMMKTILEWHDLDNIGGKWVGRVGGWIPQLPQLPIIAKYHQCYQKIFILSFPKSKSGYQDIITLY